MVFCGLLQGAIFKAAKESFPHVRGSDWLYNKWSSDYCIPDPEGNMGCRTPGHTGAVPGGDGNGYSSTVSNVVFSLQSFLSSDLAFHYTLSFRCSETVPFVAACFSR